MRDLLHHTAKAWSVGPLNDLVQLSQSQSAHDFLVFHGRADRAVDQLDPDFAFHFLGHHMGAIPYHILSTATPRISATAFLSRNCSRALMVAFTTLCGLCEPIDFVSTLGIPAACTTARTGPPAITPVPSGAGLSNTSPLPKRPSTE